MDALWLRILGASEAGGPAALLQEWLERTRWSDHLASVGEGPDEAEALLTDGDHRLTVRMRREAHDEWRIDAGGWLAPAGPARPWSALMGIVVFGAGLAVSLGYLGWSSVAFWIGVGVSVLVGALATRIARRYARRDRVTDDDPARARALLDDLAAVLRTDGRVTELGAPRGP